MHVHSKWAEAGWMGGWVRVKEGVMRWECTKYQTQHLAAPAFAEGLKFLHFISSLSDWKSIVDKADWKTFKLEVQGKHCTFCSSTLT